MITMHHVLAISSSRVLYIKDIKLPKSTNQNSKMLITHEGISNNNTIYNSKTLTGVIFQHH